MAKKRVFISGRINEMREFREAAVGAILDAGMEPLYFDSTDPQKRWPLKPGVSVILQLLEAVNPTTKLRVFTHNMLYGLILKLQHIALYFYK